MANYLKASKDLSDGKTVVIRPRGNSMEPKIKSGQEVTIAPLKTPEVGDIVLCKVKGKFYVHLVKAIRDQSYQIGNNKGSINGWTKSVFGKVVSVKD